MDNPLVAIWMVTYNHEAYIAQAIQSVMLQQTNFKFQLFIGEDHSSDSTLSICKAYQERYPEHIQLLINPTNLGSKANAFNVYKACFKSGADYIALLEGDDYWTDPLKLQKQVDFLEEHRDYTFSFTRFLALHTSGDLQDRNKLFFKNNEDLVYDFDMFTRGWYGGTLTLVFRVSSINTKIFNQYNHFRDIHLYVELLKKGTGVIQNFVSSVYRIHDSGQHNSLSILNRHKIAVLCYVELYNKNKEIPQIQKKYRYFHSEYIKGLLINREYFKALIENFLSTLKTLDLFLFKKELKRIAKYLLLIER